MALLRVELHPYNWPRENRGTELDATIAGCGENLTFPGGDNPVRVHEVERVASIRVDISKILCNLLSGASRPKMEILRPKFL